MTNVWVRRLSTAVFAAVLVAPPAAEAASAIVYTQSHVYYAYDADLEVALQRVMETCSAEERGCRVVLKCERGGFAHVAASFYKQQLMAVGAACGGTTPEDARDTAIRNCRDNVLRGQRGQPCASLLQWNDDTGE